jgi:hypothetical protein
MESRDTLSRWEEKGLIKRVVMLPLTEGLRNALRTRSDETQESVTALSTGYIIQGLEAEGHIFSDEDKAAIEEALFQWENDNDPEVQKRREREYWSDIAREALGNTRKPEDKPQEEGTSGAN